MVAKDRPIGTTDGIKFVVAYPPGAFSIEEKEKEVVVVVSFVGGQTAACIRCREAGTVAPSSWWHRPAAGEWASL